VVPGGEQFGPELQPALLATERNLLGNREVPVVDSGAGDSEAELFGVDTGAVVP
jgi:hypothetical protein